MIEYILLSYLIVFVLVFISFFNGSDGYACFKMWLLSPLFLPFALFILIVDLIGWACE